MEIFSGLLLLLGTFSTLLTVGSLRTHEICQGKPADVVFVLDSSSSISGPDFARQLNFIRGVVSIFDISPEMTRVGAVSFSNWAITDFYLNTYHRKSQIKHAIGRIQQIHGDTNTASALAFMRSDAFSPNHGARRNIPQIAIVLTDGKSNQPWMTAREAIKAKYSGIHVFAIGIGDEVDHNELRAIASHPHSKYLFHVSSYFALKSIKRLLAIETCQVTDPPTPVPITTTVPPAPKRACGDAELADIVFGPSPTTSPENTVKTLEFFHDVAATFDIDDDRVRIGVAPKDCPAVPELNVRDYTDKAQLIDQLNTMQTVRKTPVSVLRYMRTESFKPENGGRPSAKKIGVVIIDEDDGRNINDIMMEAFGMQLQDNIELFIIGVGEKLERKDLERMAASPQSRHVLMVDNYDQLFLKVERLRNMMCPPS